MVFRLCSVIRTSVVRIPGSVCDYYTHNQPCWKDLSVDRSK